MTAEEINFVKPDKRTVKRLVQPLEAYFAPEIFGLEHVDKDKPALYVANHSLYGLLDAPLYGAKIYLEKDIMLRSLGDDMHYKVPIWRDWMLKLGLVRASRENCRELMQRGEHILVFPGGTREILKKKDELYTLIWRNRMGFAKMAIENNYDIIPIASIGPEKALEIVKDSDDFHQSILGKIVNMTGLTQKMRGAEYIPPLVKGLGNTILPKPEKFYAKFGQRISVAPYIGKSEDDNAILNYKTEVEIAINKMMIELLKMQEANEDIGLIRKLILWQDQKKKKK